MNVDSCFEIAEDKRATYIDNKIVAELPEGVKASAKALATSIVESYVGRDADALCILAYAAQRGRFDEFAQKLKKQCEENLGFVDPEIRRLADIPGARQAELFFLQCYEELGIKPRR